MGLFPKEFKLLFAQVDEASWRSRLTSRPNLMQEIMQTPEQVEKNVLGQVCMGFLLGSFKPSGKGFALGMNIIKYNEWKNEFAFPPLLGFFSCLRHLLPWGGKGEQSLSASG